MGPRVVTMPLVLGSRGRGLSSEDRQSYVDKPCPRQTNKQNQNEGSPSRDCAEFVTVGTEQPDLSLGLVSGLHHYNLRFSHPVSSWQDVWCQMEEFSRHLNSQPLRQPMKLSLSGETSVYHWEMPETLCERKLSGYIGPVTDGGHHSHLQAFSFRTTNTTPPVCFGNQHFRQRRN